MSDEWESASPTPPPAADLKVSRRVKRSTQIVPDKLPPQSAEIEQSVLGCLLLDSNTVGVCIELLKEGEEAFYDLRHRVIYKVIVELWTDNDPVNSISVYERLEAFGEAEQVGGLNFLSALPDKVPSALNIEYYLERLREKALLRRMITVCTDTVGRLYEANGDVEKVLDECERDILRINESRINTASVAVKELVKEAITEVEASVRGGGAMTGLRTGFADLDKMTGGLQNSDMIVVAARPGAGKTSVAMNIVDFVAVENRIPVAVFSLEMSGRQLVKRMIFSRARVNGQNITDGFMGERDVPRITTAAGRIAGAPLYIDDTAGQSILQVRAKARRWWQQYGIKLIVIDYLQLMHSVGGGRRQDNRQQEVAEISRGVKALAKELNIPVLVVAQLNRDIEKDKNRKPRLSDLRESGQTEQDADIVSFLYQAPGDEGDSTNEEEDDLVVPVNLLIAKHRNGRTGSIPLTFFKAFTRFESMARVSDTDIPQGEAQRQESML